MRVGVSEGVDGFESLDRVFTSVVLMALAVLVLVLVLAKVRVGGWGR